MRTDPFYALLAQVGFTVLSFWMAIAQIRRESLLRTPDRRRLAHSVSLQFALPAVMSLLALAAPDRPQMWRASFVVAAAIGIGALLALRAPAAPPLVSVAFWTAMALYALVALVALAPRDVPPSVIGLSPLEAESVLLSSLVFLGLNVAFWLLFQPDEP